jgi:prepilin-type N-terminal cleavage/methylation domain-containing protein
MTDSPSRAARRGFTLVELIVSLVIFALIGGAIVKTLATGQRSYDAQVQHIDMQQNVRLVAGLLPGELREVDANDDDIMGMGPDSITIRAMRQMGFLCRTPTLGGALTGVNVLTGVSLVVRDTLQASFPDFASGDSVLIYYEGDGARRDDDTWTLSLLTTNAAAVTQDCQDGSKNADATVRKGRVYTADVRFDPTASPAPINAAGNIPMGAPIRSFKAVTYKRLQVGSEWYLGYKSGGVEQPIIGPLAGPGGLTFSYYKADNTLLTTPYDAATRARVARISIALALKTAAPIRKNVGTPAPDTSRVTLEVALRNNRRF